MSFLSNTVSLLCAGACLTSCLDAAPPEPTGVVQQKQIMLNQMALKAILLNSLIGTPEILQELVTHPLNSASFDPESDLGLQLYDADARTFMHYLVGCALGEDDPPVVWSHPQDPHQWNGRLGLCSSWATGEPSAACLEVVSACLLALENADGLSVATSQRGAMLSGQAIPLSATVPAQTRDEIGEPIISFDPCNADEAGDARDCGFDPASSLVGVCKPGDVVTLSCEPGSADSVVRICDGHRGCNHLDGTIIASEAEVCTGGNTISFTCPGGGSYAAMVGAQVGKNPTAVTLTTEDGFYPASEAEVFDLREAAFYGTLLSPRHRTRLVTSYVDPASLDVVREIVASSPSPTPVSSAMWACSDHDWILPDAYLLHRLCALFVDDDNEIHLCAAQPVGPCNEAIGNAPTNVCASVDAPPVPFDGDFDDCKDTGGNTWHNPITVYLDHPCDVVPDTTGVCDRIPPVLPQ